jgi:hypothetical protein
MQFMHYPLGYLEAGTVVEVSIDTRAFVLKGSEIVFGAAGCRW